eukprot:COSAG01_NODE_6030_length_3889_cov_124.951187_3_plen_118_part_00
MTIMQCNDPCSVMLVQTVVAGHDAETGAGFSKDFAFPLFTRDPNGFQFHLVERDLTANIRNNQVINPIHGPGVGHIAFRVDNLHAFRVHLDALGIQYSDYGASERASCRRSDQHQCT